MIFLNYSPLTNNQPKMSKIDPVVNEQEQFPIMVSIAGIGLELKPDRVQFTEWEIFIFIWGLVIGPKSHFFLLLYNIQCIQSIQL